MGNEQWFPEVEEQEEEEMASETEDYAVKVTRHIGGALGGSLTFECEDTALAVDRETRVHISSLGSWKSLAAIIEAIIEIVEE